ncbi:E3 ubiquitin-protein ligase HERC2-like isoform X2 [Watersipora subatra]|uniref:E3 ubiquitin-protein ligase HERC2-like isoform X2 n=1 Tax=Watersipora subatra TaxID=2589382 RepID=UPI00355B5C9D
MVCLGEDGVYIWGDDSCDGLQTYSMPLKLDITIDTQAIQGVACGTRHAVLWTHDGLCYSLGDWRNPIMPIEPNLRPPANESEAVLLTAVQHSPVVQVACGDRHTVFLYESGCVATLGENNHGQLGTGYSTSSVSPQVLPDLDDVRLISSGYNHCMAVTEAGELYCWGHGKAIGYKYKDIPRPTKKLSHFTNIVQLVGGSVHSLALTENGNVYSWGSGLDGQLGHGEGELFLSKPAGLADVLSQRRIRQIAASHSLSAALAEDGLLYLWGAQSPKLSGQIEASAFRPLLVNLGPVQLSHVACGLSHMAAIAGALPECKEKAGEGRDTHDEDHFSIPTQPNSKPYQEPVQRLTGQTCRKKTTIGEFYATPMVESDQEKSALPDSILLPGFKLPALLDASTSRQPISSATNRHKTFATRESGSSSNSPHRPHMSSFTRGSSSKSAANRTQESPELAQSSDEEVPSLLPMKVPGDQKHHSAASRAADERQNLSVAESFPVGFSIPNFAPLTKETERSNNVGVWNPHRNSIFNRNIFYQENASPNSGMNAKMIGFLDMSEIQLIDKPAGNPTKRTAKFGETSESAARHSRLYNKEMDLRNNRNLNKSRQFCADKVSGHVRPPFQKVTRRSQVRPLPKGSPIHISMERPQLLLEKHSTFLPNVSEDSQRLLPSPSKLVDSLRLHYRSAPTMLSSSRQMRQDPVQAHPPTPDFSNAMTKFNISNTEKSSVKH